MTARARYNAPVGSTRTRPRVLLLSIDPWVGPPEGFRPFNYSVRKIQAALLAPGDIDVELVDFYAPDVDTIERAVEERDPDIVGASVYVWSLPSTPHSQNVHENGQPRNVSRCAVTRFGTRPIW